MSSFVFDRRTNFKRQLCSYCKTITWHSGIFETKGLEFIRALFVPIFVSYLIDGLGKQNIIYLGFSRFYELSIARDTCMIQTSLENFL